ncbi:MULTISPECIES: hypothetical protein [unclassified Variovorax]|uniref:hypothetical protein n=1 Tax=unclassified Variovorax TaxID=663243 RepID=UPI00076CC0E8|nr:MULTISPECIES: hypothetical protein [unclassified Variovorax]KWT72325.1 hypothetical protein APY03_6350 [Variovorax sp. WDL1]PNG53273.1 hypothetical protein CHC06_04620 [Variovorax sp. B2]PNG53845.1 hypothetical protein CHC07_03667 [Variovorax sp. B4]VTV11306.1 hypothetical protein WDL1CHR_02181 [Variovorax sp. WDL1]
MTKPPFYIGLEEARQALSEIGINLTPKQIKRAADPDAAGRRKLPFFVDPIDGRLKIERGTLLEIYMRCQVEAERAAHVHPTRLPHAPKLFDPSP